MSKLAIIDLGTNTFNLLIVEHTSSGIKKIVEDRMVTKIGKGGINNFMITDEACHRALLAIHCFKKMIDLHHVDEVKAIATSAFRTTRNGQMLADRIREETGIEINIISGSEEAQLIFEGVKVSTDLSKENTLIMDIGGGSVEFILCNNESVHFKRSYEIGAQRLFDLFHRHDPIRDFEILNLENHLDLALKDLWESIQKHNPKTLIGSSGTFETLSQIFINKTKSETDISKLTNFDIPVDQYKIIHSDIVIKDRNDRLKISGMHEMRADMIVVASLLLNFVLNYSKCKFLVASFYSLKEGALFQMINNKKAVKS